MRIKFGFTLAEALITLVIIGVVAALVIPSVLKNYNDKKYNTARLKANASIGQAFKMMTTNGEITTSLTTKQFAENVLPKYLKVVKTCDNAQDCDFPEEIKKPNNTTKTLPVNWGYITRTQGVKRWGNTNGHFLITNDGFHLLFFYNPYCAANKDDLTQSTNTNVTPNYKVQYAFDTVCFNAIYDMNGPKRPNQVGKDIGFVGSVYNGVEVQSASVLPYVQQVHTHKFIQDALNYCRNLDKNNWDLPDVTEATVMYANRMLLNDSDNDNGAGDYMWTKTIASSYQPTSAYRVYDYMGNRLLFDVTANCYSNCRTRCVRRTSQ